MSVAEQTTRRSARSTRGLNPSAQSFQVLVNELREKGQTGDDDSDEEEFQAKNVDPDDFDVGFDGSSDDAADEAEDFRLAGGNEDDAESTTRQKSRARAKYAEAIARSRHRAPPVARALEDPVAGPSILTPAPLPRKSRGEKSRQSQRQLTVQNSIATATKASKPKRPRARRPTQTQTLTQADLIRRALDNEEGNLRQHRDYLKNEEERRKKATTLVKPKVIGEGLRWISRIELDEDHVPTPTVMPQPRPVTREIPRQYLDTNPSYTIITLEDEDETPPGSLRSPMHVEEGPGTVYSAQDLQMDLVHPDAPAESSLPEISSKPATTKEDLYGWIQKRGSLARDDEDPNGVKPRESPVDSLTTGQTQTTGIIEPRTSTSLPVGVNSLFSFDRFLPASLSRPTEPVEQTTTFDTPVSVGPPPPHVNPRPPYKGVVTRNYLTYTHEMSEELARMFQPPLQKPTWNEAMTRLFGDHVDWTKMKVYNGVKMVDKCPITGLPAVYKCPHTGVPYANKEAYKVLQQLLRREHTTRWSEELGLFL